MSEVLNKWVKIELEKCKNNPYYFARTYLKVKRFDNKYVPFQTGMSEAEFNKYFKEL